MAFVDQTLKCVDCSAEFAFSGGEAEFYQSKGLSIPKRCKSCRQVKRAKMNGGQRPVREERPQINHQDDLGGDVDF